MEMAKLAQALKHITRLQTRAFGEGYAACMAGQTMVSCPIRRKQERQFWVWGWRLARFEMAKETAQLSPEEPR